MKSVKTIFFHGTNEKNIENILNSNNIKKSRGCYGEGIYCASTIEKALEESQGNAVLGIQTYGLEKYMVMPINKIFRWAIFNQDISADFIKYIVVFNDKTDKINIKKDEDGFCWIHSPKPNNALLSFYCNKISNYIFNDFNKNSSIKPRADRIHVTKPYSIKIDEATPTLEEFLRNKELYFPEFYQTKSWKTYSSVMASQSDYSF